MQGHGGPRVWPHRPSGDLQGCLQHLHEEGVDGGVPNQLEEEEVLQALQPDGAQCRQAQEELGKPGEDLSQSHNGGIGCPLPPISKPAAAKFSQKKNALGHSQT